MFAKSQQKTVTVAFLYVFKVMMMCIMSHRFILENFVIEKHVRYILTPYPVVIWALTGNVVKNYDATSPTNSAIFIGKTLKNTGLFLFD